MAMPLRLFSVLSFRDGVTPLWKDIAIRTNSNFAAISPVRRSRYLRMYPCVMINPDGSTNIIRHQEPRKIIRLPVDFQALSEKEKQKVLLARKPKTTMTQIEKEVDSFDSMQYLRKMGRG